MYLTSSFLRTFLQKKNSGDWLVDFHFTVFTLYWHFRPAPDVFRPWTFEQGLLQPCHTSLKVLKCTFPFLSLLPGRQGSWYIGCQIRTWKKTGQGKKARSSCVGMKCILRQGFLGWELCLSIHTSNARGSWILGYGILDVSRMDSDVDVSTRLIWAMV